MNRPYMNKPVFTTAPSHSKWPRGHHLDRSIHSHPTYHGFCRTCCHPAWKCCCSYRECRKEAKELLVTPKEDKGRVEDVKMMSFLRFMGASEPIKKKAPEEKVKEEMRRVETFITSKERFELLAREAIVGTGTAFIGGGCCVHLSIEYVPTIRTAGTPALVVVLVLDSDNTILAWGKLADGGDGYCIKEGIITTNPGATLQVQVLNMTARVRWCEVFSC